MTPTIEQKIKSIVLQDFFGEEWVDYLFWIKSKSRKREYVIPRQIMMFLIKEKTNLPLTSIGLMFSDRDHSTVIHAIKTVNDLCDTDQKFKERFESIKSKIDEYTS